MRKLILIGALTWLVQAAPAQAENWYLRNQGDNPNKGVAAPLQYCLRGIAVGGGVCAGENYQTGAGDRQDQPARRTGKERR